jgi:hypothetical protein
MTPQIELLAAGDDALAEEIADLVNGAYGAGEDGLWIDGTTTGAASRGRTSP